jgi:hypothetical protein
MNGEPWKNAHYLPRAKNPVGGQVHDLQSGAKKRFLLFGCEFQKFLLEESVRDENLVRQSQKGIEQRCLSSNQ